MFTEEYNLTNPFKARKDFKITLYLNGYCIETSARKRYNDVINILLRDTLLDGEMERLERELEFLTDFLQNADFGELRKSGFDGSVEMRVEVRKKGGKFIVERI